MAHILVHVTHGPEQPTRSALGFLVGKAAIEEGWPCATHRHRALRTLVARDIQNPIDVDIVRTAEERCAWIRMPRIASGWEMHFVG